MVGSKPSDSQAAGPVLGPPKQTYVDEYDPARPNEYDDVRKDRERQRHEAQQEAERQEQLRHETQVCITMSKGCQACRCRHHSDICIVNAWWALLSLIAVCLAGAGTRTASAGTAEHAAASTAWR